MSANTIESDEQSEESVRVRDWRFRQFRKLGFGPTHSDLLASSAHVDLGLVRTLSERGCSHALILRIVV